LGNRAAETQGRALGTLESRAILTARDLEAVLRRLGLRPGGVALVHAGLSGLGYIVHGVEAVRLALARTLGPEGTLLVPTFTGEAMDPSCWVDPALPAELWNEVRDGMPFFDTRRSLPREMGSLALSVALDPDARRSLHPLASFAALGPRAEELTSHHDLRDPFGRRSPLGRALELDADVLLLGVNQTRNAAFYLAQCLADVPSVRRNRGAFLANVDGKREWISPERMPFCSEGFGRIEDELTARGLIRVARAGDGTCRLMRMGPLVAFLEHQFRLWPCSVACGDATCAQCA
jgi:aminoglycoside 3-N-acetyltransferase